MGHKGRIEESDCDWDQPLSRKLRAPQRMAISVRIGRPNRVPQLTQVPSAGTASSSTPRPGEKCWPSSRRTAQEKHRTTRRQPSMAITESRSPERNDRPSKHRKTAVCPTLWERPMATMREDAADAREFSGWPALTGSPYRMPLIWNWPSVKGVARSGSPFGKELKRRGVDGSSAETRGAHRFGVAGSFLAITPTRAAVCVGPGRTGVVHASRAFAAERTEAPIAALVPPRSVAAS